MTIANPARGEASIRIGDQTLLLRPTFSALCAAKSDLGPLFALVERATEGQLSIREMAVLFWHCVADRPDILTVNDVGQVIADYGLSAISPVLRALIGQILLGSF